MGWRWHDLVWHQGSLCLVMDYYDGGTLAERLRNRRRLPVPIVAALGLQLLAALRAVHAAGTRPLPPCPGVGRPAR